MKWVYSYFMAYKIQGFSWNNCLFFYHLCLQMQWKTNRLFKYAASLKWTQRLVLILTPLQWHHISNHASNEGYEVKELLCPCN